MEQLHRLVASGWAAILSPGPEDVTESWGSALDDTAIPASLRRRMGRLERHAIRCALGVLPEQADTEIVYCSRYGNLETLTNLLRSLANRELLSPMSFSGSVHNAAPGLVGQITKRRLSHTAIAAGPSSVLAGLIESYARLVVDAHSQAILVYGDLVFPAILAEFDGEDVPGIAMAVRLSLSDFDVDGSADSHAVGPGRKGALELVNALRRGARSIAIERYS